MVMTSKVRVAFNYIRSNMAAFRESSRINPICIDCGQVTLGWQKLETRGREATRSRIKDGVCVSRGKRRDEERRGDNGVHSRRQRESYLGMFPAHVPLLLTPCLISNIPTKTTITQVKKRVI